MSTPWQPMRGKGEGAQVAPGMIILFNTGHYRRKFQQVADLLAERLDPDDCSRPPSQPW